MAKTDGGWWAMYLADGHGEFWLIAVYAAERYEQCEVESLHQDEDEGEQHIEHYSTLRKVKLCLG